MDLNHDEDLQETLDRDPLIEAEKMTGKSYKEDEETEKLGFMMHMLNRDAERNQLEEANDTIGSDVERFIEIVESIGFQKIYEKDVPGEGRSGEPVCCYMYYHPDGLLLEFEKVKINEWAINGGGSTSLYFNLKVEKDQENLSYFNASGSWNNPEDGIWIWNGYKSPTKGLKQNIAELLQEGEFLQEWDYNPVSWFSYAHKTNNDDLPFNKYRRSTIDIFENEFPDHVKEQFSVIRRELEEEIERR